MKHTTATEKEEYSNPKHRNSKAYERFKAKPTTYESSKKCSYGDKNRTCDAGCRFWETCIKGRHEKEWKGETKGAQSNTKTKSHKQK